MSTKKGQIKDRLEDMSYLEALARVKALITLNVGQHHHKLLSDCPELFKSIPDLHKRLIAAKIDVSIGNLHSLKDDGGYHYRRYPKIETSVLMEMARFIETEQARRAIGSLSGILSKIDLAESFETAGSGADPLATVQAKVFQPTCAAAGFSPVNN